jgi:carboxymethylenebutenolidase
MFPRNAAARALVVASMNALLLALLLSNPVEVAGTKSATLHRPEGPGPFPAIMLVEGWWDAGSWEKTTAERLASDGYVVLVVMPEREARPADRDAMHAAMTAPPSDRSLQGLRAARDWLIAHQDVKRRRIAVIGARMGGRDAMQLAGDKGVAAAISWYGAPLAKPGRRAPILAFFGGKDMGPTVDDARRFAKAAAGTPTLVAIYPNAQHGFAEVGNAWGGYDETTASEAWTRATAFLEDTLKR